MECRNHKECNRRLDRLITKIKRENCKVEKLFKKANANCSKDDEAAICFDPNKDEKRQIINIIKNKSPTCCVLIEELKMHRTKVKALAKTLDGISEKYETLKTTRQNQLKQIEMICCRIENELLPIIKCSKKTVAHDVDKYKIQQQENEELEKTFEKITYQSGTVTEEYKNKVLLLENFLNNIEDESNRDKIIIGLVTKFIRKTFDVWSNIESSQVNFIEYAFGESEAQREKSNRD